jgi:hypothetical protein
MTIRQLPAHLEIFFWTFIIRLISESKFVQYCMREAYQLKSARLDSFIRLGLVIFGAGMMIGIFLGLLGV